MIKTPDEIVQTFIQNGCQHQTNIPGNRVFYTDMTASTLVHVEGQVVIEYYIMFPNIKAPIHSHPFINQMVFVGGDLIGTKAYVEAPSKIRRKSFEVKDIGTASRLMQIGDLHGFETGDAGAILYNIQIWPEDVQDARSAAIEFLGPSMGPIHDLLKQRVC